MFSVNMVGLIKPLKDKKTESVSKAFGEIFKTSKRKPKMIWSDKGSEFRLAIISKSS